MDIATIIEEFEHRDKAIMSVISTSGLNLKVLQSFTVKDYLQSFEYAHRELFRGYIPTIEDIYEFVQTDDLVSIWEIKDMFGDKYYTCNSPESTRLVMDYLMLRIQNNGPLELTYLLFPFEEFEEKFKEMRL